MRKHKESGRKTTNKSRGGGPAQKREVMRDEDPKILPQLTDQLLTGFTLRFATQGNWPGSYTVTWANLLDAWFVAGTANTAYQLFDFVKIKKVVVRAMGVPDGAHLAPSEVVGVEFPGLIGGQFGSGKQKIGSSIGYDVPAMVSARPDRWSQAAQFQPSTSNAAFIVRAVDGLRSPLYGVMIDVCVVYKNSGDISPAAVTTARAGLTPGNLYFGGIDGLATANTIAKSMFIPIA
jgi:hypothetical protein